jgi:hypothetical protein
MNYNTEESKLQIKAQEYLNIGVSKINLHDYQGAIASFNKATEA